MNDNTHEITLSLACREGILLRLLGLIERRGFRVTELSCHECADSLTVRLRVDGQRRAVEILLRQVRRLHDVCAADLVPQRTMARLPAPRRAPPIVPVSAVSRRSLSFMGIPDPTIPGPARQ